MPSNYTVSHGNLGCNDDDNNNSYICNVYGLLKILNQTWRITNVSVLITFWVLKFSSLSCSFSSDIGNIHTCVIDINW